MSVAELVLALPRQRAIARTSRSWSEPQVVFGVVAVVYVCTAGFLASHNVIVGDVLSRTENAERILFSRDPHLAAIGFVWSPLPVLALLPLIPLKDLWPALTQLGLASDIVSAIAMAFGAVQIRGVLADMGVRRGARLFLTAVFAIHPLVLYYGANGMSEALLLAFLITAVRQLMRWLQTFDVGALSNTGLALAFAYLSRYEALAAAAAVACLVGGVSWRVNRRGAHEPWSYALCDVALVAAPIMLAFLFWAGTSWLITGHASDQTSSIYGNSNMLRVRGLAGWSGPIFETVVKQLLFLAPLLPILLVTSVATLRRRHGKPAFQAAVTILGATLTFMIWADLSGSIDVELRYLITIVPLTVIIAGTFFAAGRKGASSVRAHDANSPPRRTSGRGVFRGTVVLGLIATVVISGFAIGDQALCSVNPVEAYMLQSVVSQSSAMQRRATEDWATERIIAADLDSMNLPRGSVLVDDFSGFAVVLSSRNPQQFVITSDRDFQSAVADPWSVSVKYILVPEPTGVNILNAVNRWYPELYDNGGGIAHLVKAYAGTGLVDANWRLYQLDSSVPNGG